MSEGTHVLDRWDEVRSRLPEQVGTPARLAVTAVVIVALVAGGWWMLHARSVSVDQSLPRATVNASTSNAASSATPGGATAGAGVGAPTVASSVPSTLVVQAAGAVVHPGVYRLPSGSRVSDLVAAAGGVTPDADNERLNLAAPLSDGTRVYVLHVGQASEPTATPTQSPDQGVGNGSVTAGGSAVANAPPVDLNTANEAQLDSLPGVGPATARVILDYRQQHGPFASVDELAQVRGIGPAKLAALRPHVRV